MLSLDERGLQIFNVALSCTNLMLFLIKDIQDLSQIESNSIVLNIETTHLDKLIQECLGFQRLRAEEKGIELIFEEPPGPLQPLRTDPNRLK